MKTKIIPLALVLCGAAGFVQAQDSAPPGGSPAPAAATPAPPPAPDRMRLHVLPPGARERLNLTADQVTQLDALEANVRTSLQKILTPQQLRQLRQIRPPHRGGPDGGGGPNGPGGPDGPASADRPPPPPAQ